MVEGRGTTAAAARANDEPPPAEGTRGAVEPPGRLERDPDEGPGLDGGTGTKAVDDEAEQEVGGGD